MRDLIPISIAAVPFNALLPKPVSDLRTAKETVSVYGGSHT